MIGALLLWLGCGGGGALDDCKDVACKSAVVTAAWDQEPHSVKPLLAELTTDLERVAVVNAVVQARGEPAAVLCETLPPGTHVQRCHRIASRPHLRVDGGSVGGVSEPGKASGGCEAGFAGRACRATSAAEAARRGQLDGIRKWCLAEDAQDWRAECHFQAAEAWIQQHGAGRLPDAASLCQAAGHYRGECMRHMVLSLVRGGDGVAWASAVEDAQAIRAAFEGVDPEMGEALVDRYWAEVLANAWAGPRVGEGSSPQLPGEALPHHRAGAAMRWIRDGAEPGTLSEAVEALSVWMQETGLPLHRLGEPFPRVDDAWSGEGGVSYLGASRRLVVATPEDDLAVCILEAAARSGGDRSLLESGLAHPAKEVQETARRLLAQPFR